MEPSSTSPSSLSRASAVSPSRRSMSSKAVSFARRTASLTLPPIIRCLSLWRDGRPWSAHQSAARLFHLLSSSSPARCRNLSDTSSLMATNPRASIGRRGWFLPLGSCDTCTLPSRTIMHPRKSLSLLSSESNASERQ